MSTTTTTSEERAGHGRYLLVHGAWHGSWCWDPLAAVLQSLGHEVETVDLPGRDDPSVAAEAGIADFVAAVTDRIDASTGPIVLVGHSLGGVTVTGAADLRPDRVASIVYLAAWAPMDGQSVADMAAYREFATSLAAKHSQVDMVKALGLLPHEHAPAVLYGHLSEDVAAGFGRRLVPESLRVQVEKISLTGGSKAVNRIYIETTDDCAIPLPAQRRMARDVGSTRVFTMESDHSPMLSHVEELAAILQNEDILRFSQGSIG